tara:strand:- start:797 stop:955 length:159 start_codon:yes stop_codon:yes gene_type:complete
MRHEETNTTSGLVVVLFVLAFGLVWMATHPEEVNRVHQQKMDRIMNSLNQSK